MDLIHSLRKSDTPHEYEAPFYVHAFVQIIPTIAHAALVGHSVSRPRHWSASSVLRRSVRSGTLRRVAGTVTLRQVRSAAAVAQRIDPRKQKQSFRVAQQMAGVGCLRHAAGVLWRCPVLQLRARSIDGRACWALAHLRNNSRATNM